MQQAPRVGGVFQIGQRQPSSTTTKKPVENKPIVVPPISATSTDSSTSSKPSFIGLGRSTSNSNLSANTGTSCEKPGIIKRVLSREWSSFNLRQAFSPKNGFTPMISGLGAFGLVLTLLFLANGGSLSSLLGGAGGNTWGASSNNNNVWSNSNHPNQMWSATSLSQGPNWQAFGSKSGSDFCPDIPCTAPCFIDSQTCECVCLGHRNIEPEVETRGDTSDIPNFVHLAPMHAPKATFFVEAGPGYGSGAFSFIILPLAFLIFFVCICMLCAQCASPGHRGERRHRRHCD